VTGRRCLVVLASLHQKVLSEHHENKVAGHFAPKKMYHNTIIGQECELLCVRCVSHVERFLTGPEMTEEISLETYSSW